MEIEVLRLSHRLPRDERISTHVALVARAFGASSITYTGQHDSGLEESVKRICERWGGKVAGSGPEGAGAAGSCFSISYEKSALPFIKKKKKEGFAIVHLTMYGLPVQDAVGRMREREKLLLVVGSEAVPGAVYQLADFNVAVTSQPHSEVAALAITLDRIMEGKELERTGFGGKVEIIPSERGKNVRQS
ncbi:MAG: tRNA (cytidine(56)-2'-O)-methyltransferase [Candidatus Micrarchaeota archaeon]